MPKGDDLLDAVKQQDYAAVQKLVNKPRGRLLSSTKRVHVDYQVIKYTTLILCIKLFISSMWPGYSNKVPILTDHGLPAPATLGCY